MENTDVGDLLAGAARNDQACWEMLVSRFERLVWAATYGFSFDEATRRDVVQLTWLRLLDNLDRIRDSERLGGWLSTTARRECLAVVRARTRTMPVEVVYEDSHEGSELDAGLLQNERQRALVEAFKGMDDRCRLLLRMLVCDPPCSYEEISQMMEMPVGSIGPTRARCLKRLRGAPPMVRLRGGA